MNYLGVLFIWITNFLIQSQSLSFKIGKPVNTNITVGQSVLFSSTLPLNQISSYSITLPAAMPTNTVEAAVGIIGTTFSIQRQHGFQLLISQSNSTQFTIQAKSEYDTFSPSSMVSYMKVRYIVSCHPYIGIDYVSHTFLSTDNVTDPQKYDEGCQFIRCRKSDFRATYSAPKATALQITGVAVLSGFKTMDIPLFNEVSIPTNTNWNTNWTFENYTVQNYYGVSLALSNFQTSSCQFTTTVYGFTKLSKISAFIFTYQALLTNTYYTRVVTGVSPVGCFYDIGGCAYPWKIQVWSNTTFTTDQTFVTQFYDGMYFYGLTHFIIYHQYNDADFYATPFSSPSVKMNFDVSSSSGNNRYQTNLGFTGNPDNLFSFKFGYVIDLYFNCSTTGDYMHINNRQCDTVCPATTYPNYTINHCLSCGSQCYQCTGPANNQCTSCYTVTQHRQLVTTSCQCQTLYYFQNSVSDVCPSCSHTCLTCWDTGTSNCLSCNLTDNRYDDGANSCPCLIGYYDNGGRTCVGCHYSCVSCFAGGANGCITCPTPQTVYFRNSTSNQCLCIEGYYDSGSAICEKCIYKCKTCVQFATKCTSCQSTFQRTLASNLCPCNEGFYDDGFISQCQPCYFKCKGCNGPAITDCISCNATSPIFRGLISPIGQCHCLASYFQYMNVCYACHYTCLNCTNNTVNTCLNCDLSQFRVFNSSSNQCPCKDGYFDLFSTPSTPICQACDPTCLTCFLNATNCLTCDSGALRIFISNKCPCIDGYADVGGVCYKCHYSCVTCFGISPNQCLTCNLAERYQSASSCLCRTGQYDDGLQVQCQTCHIHCLECSAGTNDTCTACDPAMMRVNPTTPPDFCYCTAHYFNSGPAACSVCSSQCETCEFNSTFCLTCYTTQFRVINSSHICECDSGYFDTGADICLPCAGQCFECFGLSTNCTACQPLRYLSANDCLCVDHYFEDNTTNTCLICDILCELCVNSSTTCTQCYSNMNRYLSNLQCVCSYGFYYDGTNVICQPCPYYCQNCSSLTVCLSCPASAYRHVNGTMCSCDAGYYDDGASTVCLACSPICQECTDYSVCTFCNSTLQRSLINSDCQCVGKFFDTYSISTPVVACQPCHYSCSTCFADTNLSCYTCQPNRNFTSYACPCNDGYYQSLQLCYLCDLNCRTCVGLPTNCTSCYTGQPLVNNVCLCSSGQYQSANICYPCSPKCKECVGSSTFCTECHASQMTTLVSNDCICGAMKFLNQTTLQCISCDITCQKCFGPLKNNCISCIETTPTLRTLNLNECLCKIGYYPDGSICSPCHSTCTTCVGPSNYNCSGCQTNFTLIGSYCKPNVSCNNYLYEGQCVNVCPSNSYPTVLHTCDKCPVGCLLCSSAVLCTRCEPGYFYNPANGSCLALCITGMYIDQSGDCLSCPSNCLECQWNSNTNSVVCTSCVASYYIKDFLCSPVCPIPYYQTVGSLCLKCLGNCLTCNSLNVNDCTQCQSNFSLLLGQCYEICPLGYSKWQTKTLSYICQSCPSACLTCVFGDCISCAQGAYLSQGKCMEYGTFYNQNSYQIQKCHPNCISCTNSSFSSCLLCRPNRGDTSQMAISGYCQCNPDSIDMGNGVCDFEKYNQFRKITESLVSYSSSTFYLCILTSVVSTNYVSILGIMTYMQSYSNFYYLNSSLVMNINRILLQYRKINPNSYINFQTQLYEKVSKRVLVQMQNDQSLFFKGQPYMFLIQWGLISAIIIGLIWFFTFVMFMILKYSKKHLGTGRISDRQQNSDMLNLQINQTQAQVAQKQQQIDNNINTPKNKSLSFQNNNQQSYFIKTLKKFYKFYDESAAIVYHIIFSSQLTFYAVASFKVLRKQQRDIQVGKLILSILLFIYIILYSVRLLIGSFRFAKSRLQYKGQGKLKNPLKSLFHMHLPQKNKPLNAIYLPVLFIRNQITSIFVVVFSYDPIAQIVSCGVVLIIWTIYSLIYCPYRVIIRVCLHITQIILVIQLLILLSTILTNYGNQYTLQILNYGNLYSSAWALMFFNFMQMTIFAVLSFFITFDLIKMKLCKIDQDKNEQILKGQIQQGHDAQRERRQRKKKNRKNRMIKQMSQSYETIDFQLSQDHFSQKQKSGSKQVLPDSLIVNQYNQNLNQKQFKNSKTLQTIQAQPISQLNYQFSPIVKKKYRVKNKDQAKQFRVDRQLNQNQNQQRLKFEDSHSLDFQDQNKNKLFFSYNNPMIAQQHSNFLSNEQISTITLPKRKPKVKIDLQN